MHNYNTCTEFNLITACLRSMLHQHQGHKEIQILFQKGINLQLFQELLIYHKVLPLLYPYLKRSDFSRYFDKDNINQIHRLYVNNAKRNLSLSGLLKQVLTMLAECGIKTVPIKGPVLAEELYGDVTCRAFSDIDILVPKEDAFKAYKNLVLKGLTPELHLTGRQFQKYQKTEDHIILYAGNPSKAIELHWELSDRYLYVPFEFRHVEKNLSQGSFWGTPIFRFSKEDLLVYLCVHGSKHCWYNLESVFLVARLLSDNNVLDWKHILCLTERIHCKTKVLLGLYLAERLFDVSLPSELLVLIKKNNRKLSKLSSYILSVIFQKNKKTQWAVTKYKFTFYQFQVMDRLRDKIRYIFFVLFFPTNYDWQAKVLPDKLTFLYFFFRPFRLIYNSCMRRLGGKSNDY